MSDLRRARLAFLTALLLPTEAWAGMPYWTLSDLARFRFSSISFFLFGLLLAAVGFRALWNQLRRDVPRLPELGLRSALAAVLLSGLAFDLVLTLISGGRELMTPGAWVKTGTTRHLKSELPEADARLLFARKQQLERLRVALWSWAAAHGNALPPHDEQPELPAALWETADGTHVRFIYVPGAKLERAEELVAYEPGLYGAERLALFADGEIELRSAASLRQAVEARR